MLAETKLKSLHQLVENLSKEELIWINGYLSGIVKTSSSDQPSKPAVGKITIAFGTETGNAKKLAADFSLKAKKAGITVKLSSLDQYRLNDLQKEEYFLAVISTHGDGEPPAAAKKFYQYIHENKLQLNNLRFSVLALGDTSYPLFCKTGEDVDAKLQSYGAQRVAPLQKCDTDFEADANAWFEGILNTLSGVTAAKGIHTTPSKSIGKKNYTGTILTKINLNGKDSSKETYHIEISADDLAYQPGDSIGVVPENPKEIVLSVLQLMNLDGSKKLSFKKEDVSVFDLLKKRLNITDLPERVVKKYAAIVQQELPSTRIDLLNLLRIYPVKDIDQFDAIIGILEPITPRLYSISSSLLAHSGEVHITVARNCFTLNEQVHRGLCSDYLTQLPENSSFEFYIHKNSQFKLPDSEKDIIMIGPGTGIAPFRAFIEERDTIGASGRNWLFFGDQHFTSDFLYQTEIQNHVYTGVLTKVNTAFSRDQKLKVYVQDRMSEQGEELYQWLISGAYLYVCGSKDPMSTDVENTLLKVIQEFGNKTIEQAQAFLDLLVEEGRYAKDVY
ncbi:MAG: flavodoxin domain-containing protein [Bacteroidia bacterium]|nr:flavodoxin domain-containing protein [Bacteroidia bacterium]